MLTDMFNRHLVTLFLILLFSVMLWTRKSFRNMATRYFWLTVISCLLLVLEDSLEGMASGDPPCGFGGYCSRYSVTRFDPQPRSACCL